MIDLARLYGRRRLAALGLAVLVAAPAQAWAACTPDSDRYPINERPMYGNVEKPAELREADEAFLAEVREMGYTRKEGSRKSVGLGWRYLGEGDLPTAMKRFNQAWLQDPDNGDAFHGFAVVLSERAALGGRMDDRCVRAEIAALFKMAIDKPETWVQARVDFGHFLMMIGNAPAAQEMLLAALEKDPAAHEARWRLAVTSMMLGEPAEACQWAKAADADGEVPDPAFAAEVCARADTTAR